MASKKSKRVKEPLGTKEFIFNVVSLVLMICVGIYFGGRSFYYFGKQSYKQEKVALTLNGSIENSNKLVQGDTVGYHQDVDGYYFKGNITNNYVKYGNRLFRVLRVNKDGSVKAISEDIAATFMWGMESNYLNSNVKNWLTKNDVNYLGVYYNSLPNPSKYLVKTDYTEDVLSEDKVISGKEVNSEYVTTLGIKDYLNAAGKTSFINNKNAFWLLGLDKDNSNLYVDGDGAIDEATSNDSYGVRAVITFKKNLAITSGNGTLEEPYIIDQGTDLNFVDSYVKLGEDIYKVSNDDGRFLRLYATDFAKVNNQYVLSKYSDKSTLFNINSRNSVANYLNTVYVNSLPYNNLIIENYYYTGEVSLDSDFSYTNSYYNSSVLAKVGLVNLFDYYTGTLDNFYLMTTASSVGNMLYIHRNGGLLEEDTIDVPRYFVPVITIDRGILTTGSGTIADPYRVG